MDPLQKRRWDQVPRSSKHPLLTGHTRRAPLVELSVQNFCLQVSMETTV
jgi:hypothetical protein